MSKSVNKLKGEKLVFPKAFQVEYETAEWDPLTIPDDSILIRTAYSLISPGTELAFYTGTHIDLNNPLNKWAKLPVYPGYATVGEVIAVGSSVHQIRPGQNVLALGHHADYDVIAFSEENVVPLPSGIDPKHALFARLAEISSTALIHSRFKPGDHVVVFGMGLIGNLSAQLYALQGAVAIGIDVVQQRLKIAGSTNIGHTIQSAEGIDIAAKIREITGREAPDIVVEATGNPSLVNVALDIVRRRGQVILLGSPRGTVEINIYKHIHSKAVSLIGAHGNVKGFDGLPSSADLLSYVLNLIGRAQLEVAPLITHVLPSSEAERAYELLQNRKDDAMGVILDWQERSF